VLLIFAWVFDFTPSVHVWKHPLHFSYFLRKAATKHANQNLLQKNQSKYGLHLDRKFGANNFFDVIKLLIYY